ncbi:MAG: hypothetical protein CL626_02360 [Aurantimonas sp.]|nr:hypothetical protein [Aurantimonas sp.]
MKGRTITRSGIVGAVVAAICCFTPILVIGLGAVGLSAWLGWLDYVLLPVLFVALGLIAYGLWRQRRAADCCTPPTRSNTEGR